jgi:hypothetical protein
MAYFLQCLPLIGCVSIKKKSPSKSTFLERLSKCLFVVIGGFHYVKTFNAHTESADMVLRIIISWGYLKISALDKKNFRVH